MCFASRYRQSYKCHKPPASGRVFCYNKGMDKKNFATIKRYAKVAGKAVLILFVLFVAIMNYGSLDNARMKR